jgi:LysR family transcriptional regulator, hydrogen peroxide-inducible genes activator
MERSVEISQIRYFMALCKTRSFTRAAQQCGVSQPSLSNAIRVLEDELGGLLFQRSPFSLTPLGRAVRPHLQAVLRHVSHASSTAVLQVSQRARMIGDGRPHHT